MSEAIELKQFTETIYSIILPADLMYLVEESEESDLNDSEDSGIKLDSEGIA